MTADHKFRAVSVSVFVSALALTASCSSSSSPTADEGLKNASDEGGGGDAGLDGPPPFDGRALGPCATTIAREVSVSQCHMECDAGVAYALCNGTSYALCVCVLPQGYVLTDGGSTPPPGDD